MCSSSCGSVGRGVASKSRAPRFESSHQQTFSRFTVNCVEKTKKEKEAAILNKVFSIKLK